MLSDDRRRDHPAEHEHVAVGEVDQLEDAVDERVAERDERVERAVRQPDQEDPEELVPVLREVDAEPDEDERDEGQADRRNDDGGGRSSTSQRDGLRVYVGRDLGLLSQLGKGSEEPSPRVVCSRATRPGYYFPDLFDDRVHGHAILASQLVEADPLFGTVSPFLSKWNVPMIPFLTRVLNSSLTTEARVPFDRAIAASMICAAWAW